MPLDDLLFTIWIIHGRYDFIYPDFDLSFQQESPGDELKQATSFSTFFCFPSVLIALNKLSERTRCNDATNGRNEIQKNKLKKRTVSKISGFISTLGTVLSASNDGSQRSNSFILSHLIVRCVIIIRGRHYGGVVVSARRTQQLSFGKPTKNLRIRLFKARSSGRTWAR